MSDDPDIHHRTPIPAKLVGDTQFGQVEVAKFRQRNEQKRPLSSHAGRILLRTLRYQPLSPATAKNGTFDVSDQLDSDWGTRVDTMDSTFLSDL